MPHKIEIHIGPNPLHGGSMCAHDYGIKRVVCNHQHGGVIVLGTDDRFHVVNKNCVKGLVPEISDKW